MVTNAKSSSPVYGSSFAMGSTYDVFFATEISGALAGHHTQTVYVKMPGDSLYQRFDVKFATDVKAGNGEQQAEKTASGYRVWVSMPVAGTMIEMYGISGVWSAQVHIDGASAASSATTFTLY
jgi:hypothetical protein